MLKMRLKRSLGVARKKTQDGYNESPEDDTKAHSGDVVNLVYAVERVREL